MYIWKVNALVRDLRWGRIGRFEKLKYGGLMLLAASLCWLGANDDRIDSTISAMLIIAAQIASIYVCYCANTHGDGRDFWMRFYTLGVPIALRMTCVVMPIMFFASLPPDIWRSWLGNASDLMRMLSALPTVVVLTFSILFWGWRVSVHIEKAARGLR